MSVCHLTEAIAVDAVNGDHRDKVSHDTVPLCLKVLELQLESLVSSGVTVPEIR
jgi:hypothetical protein